MKRQRVNSSVLRSVGYDSRQGVLEAEFVDGDVYRYHDVPRALFEALLAASSHGEFFNRVIKGGHYHFTQVDVKPSSKRKKRRREQT